MVQSHLSMLKKKKYPTFLQSPFFIGPADLYPVATFTYLSSELENNLLMM